MFCCVLGVCVLCGVVVESCAPCVFLFVARWLLFWCVCVCSVVCCVLQCLLLGRVFVLPDSVFLVFCRAELVFYMVCFFL